MSAVNDYRPPRYTRVSIPERAHPLVRKLFALMQEERMGVLAIAERAGIAKDTLKSWRTKHPPTVPLLEAALGAMGYRLDIVPDDSDEALDDMPVPDEWGLSRQGRMAVALIMQGHRQRMTGEGIAARMEISRQHVSVLISGARRKMEPRGWTIRHDGFGYRIERVGGE